MSEKVLPQVSEELLAQQQQEAAVAAKRRWTWKKLVVIVLLCGLIFFKFDIRPETFPNGQTKGHKHKDGRKGLGKIDADKVCYQPGKIQPEEYIHNNQSLSYLNTEEYRNVSLARFQGAIQIPTESNESMGPPGEDERWEIFLKLHEYFEKTYPRIHEHLQKDVINQFGLLYTWKGTDESLKPTVLMGHMDVVPVLPETVDQWKYPPYSAHFDGTYVWGRGTMDDKNPVVAILGAVEDLLAQGKQPRRTILISLGYDEESHGFNGAGQLAATIEERYGKDSIHTIVDEGGMGVWRLGGTDIATVSVAEKGNIGIEISLLTKGGHASSPPDHNGIGIISQLITEIEDTPYEPELSEKNPVIKALHCVGINSETLDKQTRKILLSAGKCKKSTKLILDKVISTAPQLKYLFQSSQSVDIINGGLKINALPEKVTIQIDNRVSIDSSTDETKQKLVDNVLTIAKKHNLGVKVDGTTILDGQDDEQFFTVAGIKSAPLEPAPITPTDKSEAWDVFAGTVKHIFEDFAGPLFEIDNLQFKQATNLIVVPALMTGNTDTRFYWNLTENIYRFEPFRLLPGMMESGGGVHTVNENCALENHIEAIAFYRQYILNL